MKSELDKNDIDENFPCLKIFNNNLVVLFTDYGIGTVVFSNNIDYSIGEYDTGWDMSEFTNYNGKVVLEN